MHDKQHKTPTKLTLAQVARGVGTSAQNLHKTYVKKGVLSVGRDALGKPFVDLVEVLRVFGDRFNPAIDGSGVDTVKRESDSKVAAVDSGFNVLQARLERALIDVQEAKAREQEAMEREKWLRAQVDRLSETIKLLEGPKSDSKKPDKRGLLARIFLPD